MQERPLLKLPEPELVKPRKPSGFPTSVTPQRRERQSERLGHRFSQLQQVFDNPGQGPNLVTDPESIAPDRAIVFEVAGSFDEFHRRVAEIGLEFLADDEFDFAPDDDFFVPDKPDKPLVGCIYLAMPNLESLEQLHRLWKWYCEGTKMPHGSAMWQKLFGLLKDVRAWGPKDRLSQDTLQSWRETLEHEPGKPVQFEVELWFRNAPDQRKSSFADFAASVAELGGNIIHQAVIAEIRYHAALIALPPDRIRELLNDPSVTIAQADSVMFIRPQSMAEFSGEGEVESDSANVGVPSESELPPIVALLDGYPVQRHQRLLNRLEVDEVDRLEDNYPVAARKHGTAMASLILHGDLNRAEAILDRPIYVRPVLRPVKGFQRWDERTPKDRLLVDVIYRAVRRMRNGEDDEQPLGESVLLVNLSLGDSHRPFSGPMSPLGRLLDYLAFEYKLLFLVSAGNVSTPLDMPQFSSSAEFELASNEDRERSVFKALDAAKAKRTLLSPAEAMNIITVGAAHRDAEPKRTHSGGVDPIGSNDLPNISSALGLGFRRVVKPDILLDGGREHVATQAIDSGLRIKPTTVSGRAFGLLVAAPDSKGGDLSRTTHTWGTSAATALATRAGHQIYDSLMDRQGGSLLADTPSDYHALIIKALLIHGASWGERAAMLRDVMDGERYVLRDNMTRVLGHGVLDVNRAVECTAERATLIGYGQLVAGEASLYKMPLPSGLDVSREYRAVTVTVAWFSPINPRHQGYRIIALEADPGGDKNYSLGVERSPNQPSHHAIRKGTVFHNRHEGSKAAAYVDDGNLLLRISAKARAGEFDGTIPYAIAVSMEVGIESSIQVYDEVRAAISIGIPPSGDS